MSSQTLKQLFYVYVSTSSNITDLFMVDENIEIELKKLMMILKKMKAVTVVLVLINMTSGS
jgi:hypothetical protein